MALEISYFTENPFTDSAAGLPLLSEARTVSGTSAKSGATPKSAIHVRIENTETGGVCYAYAPDATAIATAARGAMGHYIGTGKEIWLQAHADWIIAAITAT